MYYDFDNIYHANVLKASNKAELSFHSKIYNLECLETYMHIYIEASDISYLSIEDISEIGGKSLESYTWSGPGHPWVDIKTADLNLDVGMHVYRIQFKNNVTEDLWYQYFCYEIQTDNPEQEYIYMDRDYLDSAEVEG